MLTKAEQIEFGCLETLLLIPDEVLQAKTEWSHEKILMRLAEIAFEDDMRDEDQQRNVME